MIRSTPSVSDLGIRTTLFCWVIAIAAVVFPANGVQSARAAEEAAPTTLRLKLHKFADVTMGVPVAYAVLLPEGWTSSGNIEWSQGELSYPQPKYEIASPKGGRVRTIPAVTFTYTRVNPVPGFAPIPPQGIAPPEDFASWFVSAVQATNKLVSEVKLISSRRDAKMEAQYAKLQQPGSGIEQEYHVVTIEYTESGTRRREEASMLYSRLQPIENQNIFSQSWMLFTTGQVSAPADIFESHKAELYRYAGAVRASPQWWTQSQAALAELQRVRTEERWSAIRRRGQMINQMSDADYAKYKKANSTNSESAQRDRINSIYETSDYRDNDGSIVNLPIHYKNAYSDGQGNYLMTNSPLDKPGEWHEVQPIK